MNILSDFGYIVWTWFFRHVWPSCDTLTAQIQNAKERDELLAAMREWIDQLNHTFANEWDCADI